MVTLSIHDAVSTSKFSAAMRHFGQVLSAWVMPFADCMLRALVQRCPTERAVTGAILAIGYEVVRKLATE